MTEDANPGAVLAQRLISSDRKVELLKLFHSNPGLIDSSEGVARRIGRTSREIVADLEDLVNLGILRQRFIGTVEVIEFNRQRDREIQNILEAYFKAFKR